MTTRPRQGSDLRIRLIAVTLGAVLVPVAVLVPTATAARPAPRNARLLAFTARSGKRRWTRALAFTVDVSTVNSAGRLFITGQVSCDTSSPVDLVALDAKRGRVLWRSALGHETVGPFAAGVVVALGGTRPSTIDGFDAATGKRRWHESVTPESVFTGSGSVFVGSVTTSPAVALTRYDLRTGARRWSTTLPESPQPVQLSVGADAVFALRRPATPAAPGQTLLDAPASVLTAIDAGSGRMRWEVPVDGIPTGSGVLAVDGVAVVSLFFSHAVVAFDGATGRELWRQPPPDGTIDVQASDGDLYALTPTELRATDPKTGATRWTAPYGSSARPLVAGNGVVAIPTDQPGGSRGVTVLDARTGRLLWRRAASSTSDGGPVLAANGEIVFVETHTSCGD